MLTLIELPNNLIAQSLSFSGEIFNDFKVLIFLAIGLSIGFAIISTLRGRNADEMEDKKNI